MVAGFSQRPSLTRFISHVTCGVLLVCGLWSSGCTPLILTPTPVASAVEAEAVHLIVQVNYPTVDVLNALAGELDVWEVDRTAQTFVARVTLAQYERLQQQALLVELDCAKMAQYGAANGPITTTVADLLAEQCPQQ